MSAFSLFATKRPSTPMQAFSVKLWAKLILLLLFVSTSGTVFAAQENKAYQSIDSIKKAIAVHIQKNYPKHQPQDIKIHYSGLDNRLRLKACHAPLSIQNLNPNNRFQPRLQLSCENKQTGYQWKTLIPIKLQIFAEVVSLKHAKARGEKLKPEDLILKRTDLSKLNQGYYTRIDKLQDFELKFSSHQGQIITPNHVSKPWLIKRNQQIVINAKGELMHIRMAGKALMNGHAGDWIKVKNLNSGKIIEGLINPHGQINVSL